jgi:O-antigen/teichoic acid export membrane protein
MPQIIENSDFAESRPLGCVFDDRGAAANSKLVDTRPITKWDRAGTLMRERIRISQRPPFRLAQWGARSLGVFGHSGGGQATLALIDQLIVSGMNFITLLLLGRIAGPHELGVFALVMPLFWFLLAFQESLITVPYTIFGVRLKGDRRRQYAGATLCQSAAWSLSVSVLLAIVAAITPFVGNHASLASVFVVFAIVSPPMLLREFGRRYLFAQLQIPLVLLMTIVGAVAQLVMLGWWTYNERLTAATAFAAIGVGSGISGLGWLWLHWDAFQFSSRRWWYFARKNWILGRWLLASQATPIVAGTILLWMIYAWLGSTAIGVYAACDGILRFVNPLIIAFISVITPHVAVGLNEGGKAQLRRIVFRANSLLCVFLCAFIVLMIVAGNWIMSNSFGTQYHGAWAVLVALSINQLVSRLALAPGRALLVLEQASMILWGEVAAMISMLAVAPLLMPVYGVLGAVFAMIIGSTFMYAFVMAFYFAAMRDDESEPLLPLGNVAAAAPSFGGASE